MSLNPTQLLALVEERFEYVDGALYRKTGCTRWKVGTRAGSVNAGGYRLVYVAGTYYGEHRLIYLLHHKVLPAYVDHIDGITKNNHIENLRACTVAENQHNAKTRNDNASGVKGVCWDSRERKWRAYVMRCRKFVHVGHYHTIEEAALAVQAARAELHGEFARHS